MVAHHNASVTKTLDTLVGGHHLRTGASEQPRCARPASRRSRDSPTEQLIRSVEFHSRDTRLSQPLDLHHWGDERTNHHWPSPQPPIGKTACVPRASTGHNCESQTLGRSPTRCGPNGGKDPWTPNTRWRQKELAWWRPSVNTDKGCPPNDARVRYRASAPRPRACRLHPPPEKSDGVMESTSTKPGRPQQICPCESGGEQSWLESRAPARCGTVC